MFSSGTHKKYKHAGRVIFYLIVILTIIGGFSLVFQKMYALTIYPRVYCSDNLNLSSLEFNEAKQLMETLVKKMEKQGFSFSAKTDLGERQIIIHSNLIALTDPDLSRQLVFFDVQKTLKNAFQVGREGNFIQRTIEMISTLVKDRTIDLVFEINQEEVIKVLAENFKELEKPVQDAHILLFNQDLVLEKESPGFVLDYQTAVKELESNLKNFKNGEIKINTLLKEPRIKSENAEKVFSQARDLFKSAPYVLSYKDREWILPPEEIGSWFEFKRGGFDRVVLSFNQEKVLEYLQKTAKEINVDSIKPRLEIDNGRVVEFQVGQPGLVLNQEQSAVVIAQAVLNRKEQIDLVIDEINPVSASKDTDSLGIKELVGKGSSNFAGSPKNRRFNISVGAEKLNGILIKPEEEFSLIQAIGPVAKETGFLPELVIKGDRTIPEYGGGLCQIGTTMFRLAINTGLPITERTPHSYRVVYYEPAGMDATIYNPWPDLKFINDTGYHLLLQTEIQDNELIFKFYGTSDGRKVETTEPKVFNIVSPGPARFIKTAELPPGEKKRIESAHAGADAEFKNIVTFSNGVVREETWKSHYRPWAEVWLIGEEQKIQEPLEELKSTNQ